MSPILLFEYMAAIGAGAFMIGFALFLVFWLFVGVIGWVKRPAQIDGP